jgi:hypothetical protein
MQAPGVLEGPPQQANSLPKIHWEAHIDTGSPSLHELFW